MDKPRRDRGHLVRDLFMCFTPAALAAANLLWEVSQGARW